MTLKAKQPRFRVKRFPEVKSARPESRVGEKLPGLVIYSGPQGVVTVDHTVMAPEGIRKLRELVRPKRRRRPADTSGIRNQAAALRRLAPIIELREIERLHGEGLSQEAIADRALVSQAHVSRSLARLKSIPGLTAVKPGEVVLRRSAGLISTAEMLGRLRSWPTAAGWIRGHDGYEPGTFDDLAGLRAEGFLTDDEYQTITSRTGAR